MKYILTFGAVALFAQPLLAQSSTQRLPVAKSKSAPASDVAAVRSVLSQYNAAIERLDATGTERLFTADSTVFETGGVEGSYTNYLAKHLGPELGHFKSFKFSDYKLDVRFEGPVALATETYTYRVEPKTGAVAQRRGVATSVLKKVDGQWKILTMHNSARTPRGM
jgi:uncharacterized protein (TIGR02246 family)